MNCIRFINNINNLFTAVEVHSGGYLVIAKQFMFTDTKLLDFDNFDISVFGKIKSK